MRESLDRHYGKIVEGLAGSLSPSLFEECVQDLLREAYPGLVPIHGGQDSGMDAAISDGGGEAFPAVITTAKEVERNLTESLKSYLARGGTRRRAVVATSTALTPRRQRSLEDRARELGFTLVQIHEQRDLANRLYRNSDWTQRLLHVTGAPAALSRVPRTRGLTREVTLVGRDDDLAWLRETSGDRILLGEPGSGKTFLAEHLVREIGALFVTSNDLTAIANDLRDAKPGVVIVDDAHLELDLLSELRRLRDPREVGGDFDILAISWPGWEDDVVATLVGPLAMETRVLQLLPRADIVQILRSLGLDLPDHHPHLRFLVDQAANKPGLAVTLGSLWLRGEWQDVVTGRAVRKSLIPALRRVMEPKDDPTTLLGCFALGGDAGVGLSPVAEILGIGLGELHRRATLASHGGLLSTRGQPNGPLAVFPQALRPALLEKVFFGKNGISLDFQQLLARIENPASALQALLDAAHRGVDVPRRELRTLVQEHGSPAAWRSITLLDQEEAEWAIENYPGEPSDILPAVLERAPAAALLPLMQSSPSAIDVIKAWIGAIPSDNDPWRPIRRRQILVQEALRFLDAGGDRETGTRALVRALSPTLESSSMNATGTAVSLGYRLLHEDDITTIEKLWPQIWGKLRPLTRRSWSELSGVLERWRHPLAAIPGGVAPETAAAMIAVARRMVEDLASEAAEHPGLALRLQEWVGDDPELEVATDPELEILFPPLSREVDERAAVIQEARELGCRWASERPATMASKLSGLENEGLLWNLPWPGRWLDACHTLAEAVDRPLAWLEALLDHQVHPMAVEPLLRRVGEERPDGWETFLERCLRSDRYTALAVGVALPLIDLPGTLRELAIDGLDPRMTEHLASRGELSSEILRRLFDHEEAEIVAAAIVGTWSAEPQGSIPDDVEAEWRQAVIRIEGEDLAGTALYGHVDFWLRTILAQDGGLAEDWLLARIGEAEAGLEYVSHSGLFAAAVRPLSHEQRSRLLEHVPAEVLGPHLSSMLIQDSPDLYRRYVDRAGNPDSYLWPLLTREPTAGWVEMVRIALARGADPRRIADQAIFPPPGEAFTPSDPAYLRRWETGLQRLAEQPLEDLTEVIRHALARADELRKQADAARRDVQLYGYG